MIQIPLLAGHLRSTSETPFKCRFPGVPIMAQNLNWLGSFTILRGSGPVLLKKIYIFVIFEGRSGTPAPPPSGSAHALHPPVSKSRANVLLIFQCPGICPTPSQVDILVSDVLLFAKLCITEFLLG